MEVDDIFGYDKLVAAEKANLQAGMNYREGRDHSVVLMSLRKGAPYEDAIDPVTGMISYEGHDIKNFPGGPDPKKVDQPMTNPSGSLTENGKFYRDATDFKAGKLKKARLVKVYEKISKGIWSYKGFFELIDATLIPSARRTVFKFSLKPVKRKAFGRIVDLPHNRLIPTVVKVEVYRRDRGQCVQCGSKKNLHYDHDLPFSKGGSSLTAANVRLLCAKHNLEKSDKILSIAPWILVSASAASHAQRFSS